MNILGTTTRVATTSARTASTSIDKPSQYAYDPNRLFDALLKKLHLKNDAALARALGVAPPVISKVRHRRLPLGPIMLINMHEESDLSIRELKELLGFDPKISFGKSMSAAWRG